MILFEGRHDDERGHYRMSPRHIRRRRRPFVDDDDDGEPSSAFVASPSSHGGSAPTALTLSIVRLDHPDACSHRNIDEVVSDVLDGLTCASPLVARALLMGRRRNGDETTAAPTAIPRDDHHHVCRQQRTTAVRDAIMRYRLERDRRTSLTSLLFKSVAYYRSIDCEFGMSSSSSSDDGHDVEDETMDRTRVKWPIVDLPRTTYNRPYLPSLTKYDADVEEGEDRDHSMNVSHQYPWVCMVQRRPASSYTTGCINISSGSRHYLGIDVVVFEARVNKYAPTITDFLEPFASSFTLWEWDRITNDRGRCNNMYSSSSSDTRDDDDDDDASCHLAARLRVGRCRSDLPRLREFYLRWSMKEAYTKALGLGMHVNFDDVEIRLLGTDVNVVDEDVVARDEEEEEEEEEEGIWSSMRKQYERRRYYSTIGRVRRRESKSSSISLWDSWEFAFVPLLLPPGGTTPLPSSTSTTAVDGSACACICRGPLPRHASRGHVDGSPIALESLSLLDLIRMHGGGAS